jgi:lipopolysaccharide transport system ATP-binding protein
MGQMQEVGKEGRTILFVSHKLTAISNICSRIIHIHDGRIEGFAETGVIQNYLAKRQEDPMGSTQ